MVDCHEPRSSTPPPFLTALPLELRSYIYSYLLVSTQPIRGPLARSYTSQKYDIHTAILRTCKQINLEARQIFFGKNTFCISSVPPVSASLPSRSTLTIEDTNDIAVDNEVEDQEEEFENETHSEREAEEDFQAEIEDTTVEEQQQQTQDPPTGAFEPPLQISDLHFIRHLEIDLLYYPKHQLQLTPQQILQHQQQQQPTGADRYITNLSHLLTLTKSSLSTLSITFDARPHLSLPQNNSISRSPTTSSTFTTSSEPPTLDLTRYLLGPSSADTSPRFKSALSSLSIPEIALRFDFPEARFDFRKVKREVLVESCLVSIVGQVLMARSEIGIRGVLEEIGEEDEGTGGSRMV